MTETQLDSEFRAFCKKDGLSPSGTDYQLWKQARPLGLLPAIWAVHHSEMPEGDTLLGLQSLEPYAVSPLEPVYLSTIEVAERLNVARSWVRKLMQRGTLPYKDTPLGRLVLESDLEAFEASRKAPGRPLSREL